MAEKKTYKTRLQQEQIDPNTGEIIRQTIENEYVPGYVDMKLPHKHFFNNGEFITIFKNTMYNIAKYGNLTKNEMQLLFYLLGTAGIDNSIVTDLDILVEELNLDKGNISRSLKSLTKRNIVIRRDGYRGGGQRTLPMELRLNYDQINYQLAYNGKIKNYKNLKFNHPDIITLDEHNKTDGEQLTLFPNEQ